MPFRHARARLPDCISIFYHRADSPGFTHPSTLEIEHDPCWSMVARVFLPASPAINTAVHEPVRQIRREQKVIESHAFVFLPPFKFVIPECPERPVWM